jgi:hypothetical protein
VARRCQGQGADTRRTVFAVLVPGSNRESGTGPTSDKSAYTSNVAIPARIKESEIRSSDVSINAGH